MRSLFFRLFAGNLKRKPRLATSACLNLEVLESRITPALTYHGGPIIPQVQAQALYLGADWNTTLSSQTSQFDGFLQATVSGSYLTMLGNAGFTGSKGTVVGPGSDLAGAVDSITLPSDLLDSQIRSDLQAAINTKLVQTPTSNTLYFVFVQDNVVVDLGHNETSVNAFLAYHSSFTGSNGLSIRYAVIPYHGSAGNAQNPWLSTFDSMTLVASHELAESVTDPNGTSWYDRSGNEVGDLVVGSTVYLNGYAVQRESALPGSTTNFVPMTPAGATASRQVAFSLRSDGTLWEYSSANPTGTEIVNGGVASISNQGIDNWGLPMIDYVLTNGNAYEYHDFSSASGSPANVSAFVNANSNIFPFTSLGPNVKQTAAGQGVSYIVLTNGEMGEYVDPNYATHYGFNANPTPQHNGIIAYNVTALDAGTDKLGVNAVDYTTTVGGKTSLYEWDDVTDRSTLLASGVTSFSAGQFGNYAYVSGGAAYFYNEATGRTSAVVNPSYSGTVTAVVAGVNATGGYQLVVIYSGGTAYLYDNTTMAWSLLGTNLRSASNPLNGVFRVLLTTEAAYEYPANNWTDSNDLAVA